MASSSDTQQCDHTAPLLSPITSNTLVLDIDGTLVFSSPNKFTNSSYDFTLQFQEKKKVLYVLKRPGLDEFLGAMAKVFELVVFSAGSKAYVDALLSVIDPHSTLISRRFYRESCIVEGEEEGFVKDLSLLGKDLSKVVIMDDDQRSFSRQPQNGIEVRGFERDRNDDELMKLTPLLLSASKSENVMEWVKKHREDLKRRCSWRKAFILGHAGRGPCFFGNIVNAPPSIYKRCHAEYSYVKRLPHNISILKPSTADSPSLCIQTSID